MTRNKTDNPSTNRSIIRRTQKWEENQLYGHFKCQTRLCRDRNETINHMINECIKLEKKSIRHAWVGNVIKWELCKQLKFDHRNKWYMHTPESVLDNETRKFLWGFEIKTDPLISARWPHLLIVNKKKKKKKKETYLEVDSAVPADHRINLKENERMDKFLDFARELKKLWNIKMTVIPNGTFSIVTKGLVQELEDLEIRGRVLTIQTTLKKSRRLEETCCYSDTSVKPSVNAGAKNSQKRKIIKSIIRTFCFKLLICKKKYAYTCFCVFLINDRSKKSF